MTQWMETHRAVIHPWYCDHLGHMNVRFYAHFFDDAGFHIWNHIEGAQAIMKKYGIGIITGILLGVSSVISLGSSSIGSGGDRYEYISGSTVDMKIFDKRTGKMYVRGRDFVTEYDIINAYYRVRTYSLYEE